MKCTNKNAAKMHAVQFPQSLRVGIKLDCALRYLHINLPSVFAHFLSLALGSRLL